MPRFLPDTLCLALPLALLSTTALADLTPAQVWGDWRSYLEGMGYAIDADETKDGDDITLSDLTMNFDMPEDGSMSLSMGPISFRQNGDGTVSVMLPDRMPLRMSGTSSGPASEKVDMTMIYSQTGHALTASGTPDEMTYLYIADTIGLSLEELMQDGQAIGRDQARIDIALSDVETATTMVTGDLRDYSQTGSVAGLTYDLFFIDPEQANARASIKGGLTGLAVVGGGKIPMSLPDAADMSAMLAAGFEATGGFTYSAGSSTFDVQDPESGNFVMVTSSSGGELGVDMGAGGLSYLAAQRDMKAAVTIEGMPFPFEIAMARAGFNVTTPVMQGEAPQNFALGLDLADFTMSDMIWSTFDPAGQLPRDPATIVLDLSGKLKLLMDWMDPEAAANVSGPPAEVEEVRLGNLLVSAAGARLEGSGEVAFSDEGPELVPGMGTPVGTVNFSLAGGNALLDKLVAMGLLPQDQAMGARMMMGLFAVPGDAPDTLTSKIDFTQDGQILANGQRIR